MSSQMDVSFLHTTITTDINNNETSNADLQSLHETMDTLLVGIQVLNDEAQRLSSESLRDQNLLETFSEDLSKIKTAIQETNLLIDAHKSNQEILQQDLASLQQQVDDQMNISYDGTLIWKITNVRQKIGMLTEI
jgi:hypothetical protein